MRKLPKNLTPVDEADWPKATDPRVKRFAVWRSRDYLVQAFEEDNLMTRLSMCRTTLKGTRWDDGLTWDEIQGIKQIVGYGDSWAVEIYPATNHVINVANMRHLWLLPEGAEPEFGWRK
jgi:hypothetical protein